MGTWTEWNQDGNLNGNPNGNLNVNLNRNLDGNLHAPNLGPNWDQTWTKRISLGVLGRSLGNPWVVFGAPWKGPLGTKLGPSSGPALVWHWEPKECLKCVTVIKSQA